jgi:hypothetical protein
MAGKWPELFVVWIFHLEKTQLQVYWQFMWSHELEIHRLSIYIIIHTCFLYCKWWCSIAMAQITSQISASMVGIPGNPCPRVKSLRREPPTLQPFEQSPYGSLREPCFPPKKWLSVIKLSHLSVVFFRDKKLT